MLTKAFFSKLGEAYADVAAHIH